MESQKTYTAVAITFEKEQLDYSTHDEFSTPNYDKKHFNSLEDAISASRAEIKKYDSLRKLEVYEWIFNSELDDYEAELVFHEEIN